MNIEVYSQTDGILYVLNFLYFIVQPNEIHEFINRLSDLTLVQKDKIKREILYVQDFIQNIDSINNSKQLLLNQPHQLSKEIHVMSGGNYEIPDILFPLYEHWNMFRINYHIEFGEMDDINIFQYWLLLWIKIMDAIHDFMKLNNKTNEDTTEDELDFLIRSICMNDIKLSKTIIQLEPQIIVNFLTEHSHSWEKLQFTSDKINTILNSMKSNPEENFIRSIPYILFIEIYSNPRHIISQLSLPKFLKVWKKNKLQMDTSNKKSFIELFKRYSEFIYTNHFQVETPEFINSMDIAEQNERIDFYTILKIQQLIYHTSQKTANEIPVSMDATRRSLLLDKWFIPYTFVTNGFHIIIKLFLDCDNNVNQTLRRILYQAILLVYTENLTIEEKRSFYKSKLIPQIQELNINTECSDDDIQVITDLRNLFPNVIQKIMFLGGVIDEDTEEETFDDYKYPEMSSIFDNKLVNNLDSSRDDLQWAIQQINQPEWIQPTKRVITDIRDKLLQIKRKIRNRKSPRKNYSLKQKQQMINTMNDIHSEYIIFFTNQIESAIRDRDFLNQESNKVKEYNIRIQYLTSRKTAYNNKIMDIIHQLEIIPITGMTETDKQLFESQMDKIIDDFGMVFASDYLYVDYQTIFWKHYMIHYKTDASLWDAAIIKSTKHTDLVTQHLKPKCNFTPTRNVFGTYQKKLYSNYYLELGGISKLECDKIDEITYKGAINYKLTSFQPHKYHSIAYLNRIIQYKQSIEMLPQSQQNKIQDCLKAKFQNPKTNQNESYLCFLLWIPIGTLFAIKRSGDWSQIQHCLMKDTFFISFDRLALFYAFYRGVGFFAFMKPAENEIQNFYGGKIIHSYQESVYNSLNQIGDAFIKSK